MAKITAKMVQELRSITNAGMMDCKKALTESEGDMDAAIKILREKGMAAAANRAGKVAAEGLVEVKLNDDLGVIVEINSETDFVAKNENFINLVNKVCELISKNKPADLNALKNISVDENTDFETYLKEFIAKMGENINIRRFEILEKDGNSVLGKYIHLGGKIGVLLKVSLEDISKKDAPEFMELLKDLTLQIAAAAPQYLVSSEIPESVLNNEREIYATQMRNEGKPEKIISQIVEGKLRKFYEEVCLENQIFVKDNDFKVKKVIDEASKKLGTSIKVEKFVRYKVGEGIEKKEVDFAEEVRAQVEKANK